MTKPQAPTSSTEKIPTSFYSLIKERALDEHGPKAYLEDARSSRIVTYAGLLAAVDAWQTVFASIAPASQAAILVDLADPLSFSIVHLAAISAGKRSLPVDPGTPATELDRLSDLIGGASLVVSDRENFSEVKGNQRIIGIHKDTGMPNIAIEAPTSQPASSGGSVVLFTSGSTGTPKGVELPEEQLLYVGYQIAKHNKLTENDRGFNSLPLFHVNAEVVGVLATLISGSTLVLDDRFHREGFWELLHERKITWLNAVPAILAVLSRGNAKMDLPKSLRFIRSASSPLPDAVRENIQSIELVVSYGMTEGASQITATPLGQPRRPGSVGLPIGNELQIRNADEEVVPTGEVGTVWIRGKGVVKSYLFNRASERFDKDGWLNTSDLGKVDEDGYVYLMGRSDDVINRGGEKLYPAEIEEVLLQDTHVREVVVAAMPDAILHQVPLAFVIPAEAGLSDEHKEALRESLLKLCEAKLTRFKRPVDIIISEDLPRAPTGKIQRVKVRELAAQHSK